MTKNRNWWGEFTFALGDIKSWHIGERTITIKREKHKWTVWDTTTDAEENVLVTLSHASPKNDVSKATIYTT